MGTRPAHPSGGVGRGVPPSLSALSVAPSLARSLRRLPLSLHDVVNSNGPQSNPDALDMTGCVFEGPRRAHLARLERSQRVQVQERRGLPEAGAEDREIAPPGALYKYPAISVDGVVSFMKAGVSRRMCME